MKYVSELRMIDKMEKNPHFSPILKWKHPSIWQLFWCDRELPFDDYDLYEYVLNLLNLVAIAIKVVTYSVCDISQTHNIVIFSKNWWCPLSSMKFLRNFHLLLQCGFMHPSPNLIDIQHLTL